MTYLKSSKEMDRACPLAWQKNNSAVLRALRVDECPKQSDGIGCNSKSLDGLFCVG
jgi:hypothetical protein